VSRFFRWYGALLILLVMWVGTSLLYWTHLRDEVKHQAEEHGQAFDEDEFRSQYWAGYFENHQSEYAQLFFQGLLIGALGSYLFKKEKEDILRIEAKVDALLREQGRNPNAKALAQPS
jgi:hypothetical protein